MKITEEDNILILEEVEDFVLSQILECGQCFNFVKYDQEEYDLLAYGKALHVKQIGNKVLFYDTTENEYKKIWQNYFDLNTDYHSIKDKIAQADVKLLPAIEAKKGIRILNQDFFETLISFIISQNKQIPQIKQCVKNISNKWGKEIIGYKDTVYHTFPSIESLYYATEEELRECKVGFRAPYIADACKKVYEGLVTNEKLDKLSTEDARELLMSIKGVGEKVANCVLLFSLGRREAFPVDVWIKRIMEQMYFQGQDMKKPEIEKYAKNKFGNLGGYAQQYLFDYYRNLENQR